jgi:hypothetical protein
MKPGQRFGVFISLVGVTIFAFAGIVAAQDYRARVQGIVTDTSQAVVPGATVMLRNENTGVEIARESSENGHFLFDFVEPGRYTLTAELSGFSKFVQQNIQVQVRGDVTVNPILNIGTVSETVTVSGETVAVQFNTTTMELTVDRKMLSELPILARNPFTLALLDPAVVNRYATLATRNPFFMWSSSQMDVGGSTSQRNDLQLDGAPLQLGWKGSYAPPMDAVQEFTVQQNSVDAEFGHSAGGVLSLSMKSGTNDYHGTAYYFGRNPALNAVSNSVVRAPNAVRNHIWGGTLGNPIIKNKLFTFNTYEAWSQKDPRNQILTLPTELERQGDFSRSFNQNGTLRTIYDPLTTVFDAAANRATRTPFPGNIIPQSRMDPTSLKFLQDIWLPNGPGDGITGVNNYKVAYHWLLNYWNFSNRTDWIPNDNWKIFGRYSRFRTDIDQNNYTPNNSAAMPNDNGGVMNSRNIAGDAVWTVNQSTFVNFRFSYATLNDDYDAPSAKVGEAGLQKFWPNGWFKPYLAEIPDIYYPNLNVNGVGSATFGKGGWWYQHPQSYNWSGRVSKNIGRHYLKAGGEERLLRGSSVRPNLMGFSFGSALTADTFLSPDTRFSGDAWATFLLGAIGSDSTAQFIPLQKARTDFYAVYLHDDWKLSRRLTLNVGLRWEYETGLYDAEDRLSRALDLTSPIPEMQTNPPDIPADIAALRGKPYVFNGAWVFTEENQRSSWDSPKNSFMPRFGVAYRIDDRTALRVGYARYITPPLVTTDTLGSARYPGFSARTDIAPVLQGIPSTSLSDPFPTTSNPLILPIGKGYGRYTNLGSSSIIWDKREFRSGINDRFNVSIQRQMVAQLHIDVTYFVNLGHDLPYNKELNMVDPNLVYTHKAVLNQTVPNPFFNYLTPEKFPGQLRNQPTVTRRSLLSTYPQYGSLTQVNTDGFLNRYHALQIRLQRQFTQGYSFLVAYNYNREKSSDFFNDIAQFNEDFTFLPSNNPRHRMAVAGTWDLPFGHGRTLLADAHPVVNGILGGWSTSWLFFANSGGYLRFNNAFLVTGDPRIEDPTPDRWFDTSVFSALPAFTPRTNPKQYDGLTGPKFWNIDFTLAKVFPIDERYQLEFRLESFNLTNSFIPTDPVINALGPNFGKCINQLNRGRELQYTVRLQF